MELHVLILFSLLILSTASIHDVFRKAYNLKAENFLLKKSRLCQDHLKSFQIVEVSSHLPKFSLSSHENTYVLPELLEHPDQTIFSLELHGKKLEIPLSKSAIFASGYTEFRQAYRNGKLIHQETRGLNASRNCHYYGELLSEDGAPMAAVSTCKGAFRGLFHLGEYYGIEPAVLHLTKEDILQTLKVQGKATEKINFSGLHLIYKESDLKKSDFMCLEKSKEGAAYEIPLQMMQSPSKRRLLQNENYVELLVVNDAKRYQMAGQETEDESNTIVNMVNSLYVSNAFTPPVSITLIGQVTWSEGDPYTTSLGTCSACSAGEAGVDGLLSNFQAWRRGPHAPAHDNAQLFSGFKFQGTVLGYANVGSMCDVGYSGGINQVWGPFNRDASVVAHEMGHNFGMQHDSQGNSCPPSGFVMNAIINIIPNTFSSCSKNYYNSYISDFGCLENVPTTKWGIPVCGNGFVETGEECDCGLVEECTDLCCNPATCLLRAGAACTSGQACCNPDCSVNTNTSLLCRPASGECDLPEYCDGVHGACPSDWFKGTGTSCTITETIEPTTGQCFSGSCINQELQCESVTRGGGEVMGACDKKTQSARNDGEFCGTLYCYAQSVGDCVALTLNNALETVRDGVECDSGKQCYKGNCVASSQIQPEFFWQGNAWGSCGSCEEPQTRNLTCFYQDTTQTEPPPPYQINPIYCSPTSKPPTSQTCDNVTLGCISSSILSGSQITFFGLFTVNKIALTLYVLGVIALLVVILGACYHAVTYEAGVLHNPRVRQIGKGRGQVRVRPQ